MTSSTLPARAVDAQPGTRRLPGGVIPRPAAGRVLSRGEPTLRGGSRAASGPGRALHAGAAAVHHPVVEPAALRVVIAEDSVLLREGLARLVVESGATVVAAVGDGPAFVAAVEEHRPDVSHAAHAA
jgi:hypothetical protein